MSLQRVEASARVRRSVAKSIGTSAAIYGYPLVEMLRMCRAQTHACYERASDDRVPIDTVRLSRQPPFDSNRVRDVGRSTYATAWMNLADGPRSLQLAEAALPVGRRLRLSFYDASSELIAEFDRRALATLGGRLVLHGPHTARPADTGAPGVLRCATDLVWLVGRFVDAPAAADDGSPPPDIRLTHPSGLSTGRRPAAVELWKGPTTDALIDIVQRGLPASEVAPCFFGNLCSALAHLPPRTQDELLLARLRASGISPGPSIDWAALAPWVREGLTAGLQSAAEFIATAAKGIGSPDPGSGPALRSTGRPDYIARAAMALRGIGIGGADLRAISPAPSVPA